MQTLHFNAHIEARRSLDQLIDCTTPGVHSQFNQGWYYLYSYKVYTIIFYLQYTFIKYGENMDLGAEEF